MIYLTKQSSQKGCHETLCLSASFETGSQYVALDGLKLNMYTRLSSNSLMSMCLCLASTEIKGVYYHALLRHFFKLFHKNQMNENNCFNRT